MNSELSITFGGRQVPLIGKQIKVGDKAPNFTVIGQDLKPVSFSDYEGMTKIISVFPSIDTPVCAAQNRIFNKRVAELHDTVVLSISVDLPFAQKRFCGAEGISNVVVLSDHRNLDFGTKYGLVLEDLRLLARAVVIVDKHNFVKYVEIVSHVGHEADYNKAFDLVKTLQ